MLSQNDRDDLKYAMKASLVEYGGGVVYESYICHELTYEQALNLCFNHDKETLLEASELEPIAILSICEVVTEAKKKRRRIKPTTSAQKIKIAKSSSDFGKWLTKKHISKTNAGLAGLTLALTGVGAWFIYKKLRRNGIDKKTAAEAAAKVAKTKAIKSGLKKDKDVASKWANRARTSSK